MKKLILLLFILFSLDSFCQVFPTPTGAVTTGAPVNLGLRFVPKQSGTVTGLMYYRNFPGTVTGQLWSIGGDLLASVAFADNTSGWKKQDFITPIPIQQGFEYVISYYSSGGGYFIQQNSLPKTFPLFDAVNSVYKYGNAVSFPTLTYNNSNYFVEPVIVPAAPIKDTVYIIHDTCYFDWEKDPLQLTLMLPEEGGAFMLPDSTTAYRALYGAAQPHQRLKNDTSLIAWRSIVGTGVNRRRITLYITGAYLVEEVQAGFWVAVNQRFVNGQWITF